MQWNSHRQRCSWYGVRTGLRACGWTLVGSLLFVLSPARAAVDVAVANAEAPLAGRSNEQAEAAAAQALSMAIVRLTGLAVLPDVGALASARARASRLVVDSHVGGSPGAPTLVVAFDERALRNVVADAGLPLWPRRRPQVVMWLAFDDGVERLLGADPTQPLAAALIDAAKRRGLPLALPLLDLDDTGRVSAAVARARFVDTLQQASRRYGADLIIAGSVRQDPLGAVVAELGMLAGHDTAFSLPAAATESGGAIVASGPLSAPVNGESSVTALADPRAQTDAAPSDAGAAPVPGTAVGAAQLLVAEADVARFAGALVDQVVRAITEVMAQRQAAQPQRHALSVIGIDDLEAYAGTLNALGRLDFVDRVDVRELADRSLHLDVWSRGSLPVLLANVGLLSGSLRLPAASGADANAGSASSGVDGVAVEADAHATTPALEWHRR